VPGRRRGARTGRGWDAAPPRPRAKRARPTGEPDPDRTAAEPARDPAEPARASDPAEPARASDPAEPARQRGDPAEPARQRGDPAELAREICLRQLAVRPRTRAELATALRRQGIADEVAAEVLDRYDEVGLIDDAAFARAWVTSRHHGRGLARRALAGELRRRGIDSELVGAALAEVDGETEAATARALVQRRLRVAPSGTPQAVFRRLVGLLAGKGYSAGLAVSVVKNVLAARDDEFARFAESVDPDALSDLVGEIDDPLG
jgi:regulatory protein